MAIIGLLFGLLVILPIYLVWMSAMAILGHFVMNPLTYAGVALMVPTTILAVTAFVQSVRLVVWAIRSRKASNGISPESAATERPSMTVLASCSVI